VDNDHLLAEAFADNEVYDLLVQTALDELQEPVQVYSDVLGDSFYLCATQHQAQTLLAQGKVAYLPVEIRIFRVWKQRWPERFPELLRRTHQAQRDLSLVLVNGVRAQTGASEETWERTPMHCTHDSSGICILCPPGKVLGGIRQRVFARRKGMTMAASTRIRATSTENLTRDMNAAVARSMTYARDGYGHATPRDVAILARAYNAGVLPEERFNRLDSTTRIAVQLQASYENNPQREHQGNIKPWNEEAPLRRGETQTDRGEWKNPESAVMARLRVAGYDARKRYTEREKRELLQEAFGNDIERKIAARLELNW
jgi:hypothetical protein